MKKQPLTNEGYNAMIAFKLYEAFRTRNFLRINECYHDNAIYSSPFFDSLKKNEILAMWKAFLLNDSTMELTHSDILAEDVGEQLGEANWEVKYTYRDTKRRVNLEIKSKLQFKGGKVFRHEDSFNFYLWATQAYEIQGVLFGIFGFFRNKIKRKMYKNIEFWINNELVAGSTQIEEWLTGKKPVLKNRPAPVPFSTFKANRERDMFS
jgi:SnoaL-like domain